jgi:hypothetical protein
LPIIHLTQKPNNLIPDVTFAHRLEIEVISVMAFPSKKKDIEKRNAFVNYWFKNYLSDFTNNNNPITMEGSLYKFWRGWDSFKPEYISKYNFNKGMISGKVVIDCILFNKSINYSLKSNCDKGRMAFSSMSAYEKIWKEYRSISPYYAAYYFIEENNLFIDSDDRFFITVSIAEYFRELAESTIPKGGNHPILLSDEAWRIPKWFPRVQVSFVDNAIRIGKA